MKLDGGSWLLSFLPPAADGNHERGRTRDIEVRQGEEEKEKKRVNGKKGGKGQNEEGEERKMVAVPAPSKKIRIITGYKGLIFGTDDGIVFFGREENGDIARAKYGPRDRSPRSADGRLVVVPRLFFPQINAMNLQAALRCNDH